MSKKQPVTGNPTPRGWQGNDKEFAINCQQTGRQHRFNEASGESYDYPGVDMDEDDTGY